MAPPIGEETSPDVPMYHWYVRALAVVVVALTVSVVGTPSGAVTEAGCAVIVTSVQGFTDTFATRSQVVRGCA